MGLYGESVGHRNRPYGGHGPFRETWGDTPGMEGQGGSLGTCSVSGYGPPWNGTTTWACWPVGPG